MSEPQPPSVVQHDDAIDQALLPFIQLTQSLIESGGTELALHVTMNLYLRLALLTVGEDRTVENLRAAADRVPTLAALMSSQGTA